MKTTSALFAALGALALSGCAMPDTTSAPVPVTGGDLTGMTATNCRAAIARQTNLPISDVAIFDVVESEAGNTAQATVAGAEAPWICRTDRNGTVNQVMFSGQG